ncbi:MAG: redoxin domain-containing protein [Oscillospiraceae bacterium]
MNHFKKYLSLLLALTLMLSAFSGCGKKAEPAATEAAPVETTAAAVAETEAAAEQSASDAVYNVGDKIDDFTITTYDGKEVNLYKLLEEKDMVLLNLWATYCGPCAQEFPAMQEAYEQYQDKVEIIALSGYEADTDEVLAEYVQEKGMTFFVGKDTVNLRERMKAEFIPTSIVVDRFGTICLIESGGMPDPEIFTHVFEIYTAEDYTEPVFMPTMLAELPTAQPADPAQLNEALNAEGGDLVFTNSPDRFYWPMTVEQKDGRMVAAASNVDSVGSEAVVETQVDAKAGDVLVMDYKFMSGSHTSNMIVKVDNKDVKVSSIDKDWTTYAYRFEEGGNHQISVTFKRDFYDNDGSEGMWIDSIRLISGDEAEKAMANKIQYPVAEETRLELVNENVEAAAIVLEGTNQAVLMAPICPDPVLRIAVALDETMDPETAFVVDCANNAYPLTEFATEDGYLLEIPNENPSAYLHCGVVLFCNGTKVRDTFIFVDLEQAGNVAKLLGEMNNLSLEAVLWDDSMAAEEEEPQGDGTYTVTYVDQNGDPVPGVMCQVCDATTCQVFVSDASGVCEFTLPVGAYEIHTLKVPAGYEGDTTTITEAPMGGGELSFTLTKK